MKTPLIALAVTATIFVSCNNNPTLQQPTTTQIPTADTAGLAQFQNWKTQQEMVSTNGVFNGINEFDESQSNSVRYAEAAPVARTYRTTTTRRSAPTRTRSVSSNRSYGGGGGSYGQTSTRTAPARKRGWSKAAKGTAIGAGSGAVLGAIVSKKKGKGAIIGGLLGAGAGYVIGRAGDKRDGRY